MEQLSHLKVNCGSSFFGNVLENRLFKGSFFIVLSHPSKPQHTDSDEWGLQKFTIFQRNAHHGIYALEMGQSCIPHVSIVFSNRALYFDQLAGFHEGLS